MTIRFRETLDQVIVYFTDDEVAGQAGIEKDADGLLSLFFAIAFELVLGLQPQVAFRPGGPTHPLPGSKAPAQWPP